MLEARPRATFIRDRGQRLYGKALRQVVQLHHRRRNAEDGEESGTNRSSELNLLTGVRSIAEKTTQLAGVLQASARRRATLILTSLSSEAKVQGRIT